MGLIFFPFLRNFLLNKKAELSAGLPGSSMMDLLDGSQTKIRTRALFAYEMISMIDSDMMQTTDPTTGVTSSKQKEQYS